MALNEVFLCDRAWRILTFLHHAPDLPLAEGAALTELIDRPDLLRQEFVPRGRLTLTFPALSLTAPALIRGFDGGYLVLLADGDDALTVAERYEDAVEWAKDHFEGIFHNEYYQIQQLNNQLVNSKRALARSNSRLHQALEEVEQTNHELEQAHEAVRRALALAEQANRSKSAFLASVSHDIRTPMNAIVGFISLLEHENGLTPRQLGYLDKMRYSSRHLLSLINDVLDLSKLETSGLTLEEEPISLRDQIEQVDAVIRPQAQNRQQEFAVSLCAITHDALRGDGLRLRQVLMNLLSNAVKYTQEGGRIVLSITELTPVKPGCARLRFDVTDNGCGMTEEFAEHIFDPFTRDKRAVDSGIQGTGLGMAITKNIVDLMGGRIGVTTEPDVGSSFCVILDLPIDTQLPLKKDRPAQTGADTPTLEGKRFLCAEDNELNAEILTALLEMSGASCTIYPDGAELVKAFSAVRPGEFDAILTDVQMPNMNGLDAARAIRRSENPLGQTIPIIAMTADAFSDDIQACLDAGMNAHVAKPLDMDVLARTLRGIGQ